MKSRITYDIEAKLSYLYTLPLSVKDKIASTIELEVNEYLGLDIDEGGRIVGIELSKIAGSRKFMVKMERHFHSAQRKMI